jgi:uncharacterized protein (TIGR00730 family)
MNEESLKPVVNLPAKDLNIEPITLHEVEEENEKRLSLIDKEFSRGFDFIKDQPKSVTIFGSSRFPEDNEHYQRARRVGAKLANLGYSVITGGGPGIMEGANRGAFEVDGRSLGLTIKLPNEQVRNPYLTDTVDFYYFFTRKVMLAFSAEAYLFFPGGFGTFDELFEILTLIQTKKIEKVPVILVGSEFWNSLDALMREQMFAKNKAIDETDFELYRIMDNEDEIVQAVQAAPVRNGVRLNHK